MPSTENAGYEYREQLGPPAHGRTVLAWLAARYRHSSEARWGERIAAGEVRVDGAIAGAGQVLRQGQILTWNRPAWPEPEVPLDIEIIHEDADLLVVAKPSGLPTAPAGGFLAHTLQSLVRKRDPDWSPMHRLGRGTSGLVLFARTKEARAALHRAFRESQVEKLYRALASGALPEGPRVVTAPIGEVEHPLLGTIHAASPEGRPARSEISLAARRGGDSLAEVRIATGRPHQIRIHLAFLGHPLVGEPLYGEGGVPRPGTAALPGDLGYRLHAWRLGFIHPRRGERVEFEAPLPEWAR